LIYREGRGGVEGNMVVLRGGVEGNMVVLQIDMNFQGKEG
jgi:hypothetical protein